MVGDIIRTCEPGWAEDISHFRAVGAHLQSKIFVLTTAEIKSIINQGGRCTSSRRLSKSDMTFRFAGVFHISDYCDSGNLVTLQKHATVPFVFDCSSGLRNRL